ncbi:MAG: RNA polymerase sigma factor [Bacteroidetes bacterium]|nr:RNA polymerase sigma factor [Bacteroidota bacterium]
MENIKQKNAASDITDEEVIKEILSGNKNAYEIIMRRYNQRLFRIGRSFINDDDEVQDVLQASYIKAYENLQKFEHRSAFPTWLTRIVINESMARNIKNKKSNLYSSAGEDESRMLSLISKDMNPEEKASNNELKEALEKVIDNLPLKYRTVFVMREIEKMSIAETSECLKLTEGNVKVRLNRAKEILRKNLINVYKENEVFSFLGSRCDRIVSNVLSRI